ncbi:hypothetical protein KDX27_42130 [Burkholderia cenocepacia]|uniref:hypothetical protein n=1 Tax=Burkholderia cenocepacia TaxID=95486 RepID=UPI001B9232D0|nr:hypothetical protein [Burkholderia cenocepacia]MBR8025197.1 hypothetical protein [Burkholderia cenocepacia]MBR8174264.1 hypothetical protein [Burkholderia cenocepacia]
MSGKALKACADYARLNAEIKQLTKRIGDLLHYCKGVRGTCGIGADGMQYGDPHDVTHLKHAFTPETDDSGNAVFLTAEEILEYLNEHCDCCLKAYGAVIERKAAKKQLGAVKRSIGAIGRAELAREA